MLWKNCGRRVFAALALCTAAGLAQAQVSENFDTTAVNTLPATWASTSTGAGAPWVVTAAQSSSAPNSVFTNDVGTVSSQFLELPPIIAAGTVRIEFMKRYDTEATYDGFTVEVQINGGGYSNIGTAAFTTGGYNQAAISLNFASPIAGQPAFSGAFLTWTSSIALISATAGDSVQFRFHMASDSSVTDVGVWIDNVITSTSSNFGACCDTLNGTCSLNTAGNCTAPGNTFQGMGSACPSTCPASGACCDNSTAVCTIRGLAGCGVGSTYQGDGTLCAPLPCATEACCNTVTGACIIAGPGACPGGTVGQGASTVCVPSPCPPPANDICSDVVTANAPIIPGAGGIVMGSNATATTDGAATCTTGHKDVYFLFTPSTNNAWIFRTCATAPAFDTMISVHTGCPADISTQVAGACNDDSCGLLSSVTVAGLASGTQYIVRVGNFGAAGAGGTFTLEVISAQLGACCNNTTGACTSSTTGAAGCAAGTTYQGDNTTCTPSPCAQEACCNATTGACAVSVPGACPSGTTGQGVGTVCTPNPCPQPPGPANDDCAAAIVLVVNDPPIAGTNVSSTDSGVTHSCTGSTFDVWYSFVATAAGTFTATADSDTGELMSIVAYDSCGGAELGCQGALTDPGVLTFSVPAAGPYVLRVATFATTTFNVNIVTTIAGACCNNTTGACTTSVTGAGGCASGTTYQGDNSVCNPSPCVTEACCNAASGACTTAALGVCPSGTTGQGTGSVCLPNPCPQPPPPANDDCANAIALTLNVAFAGTTVQATGDGTEGPGGACYTTSPTTFARSVWFTFTAPASDVFGVTACGSAHDTVLSVFDGNCAAFGAELGCDDDTCDGVTPPGSGLASIIAPIAMTSGQTYIIRLASWGAAPVGGTYTITVTGTAPPAGVCCRGATCSTTVASSAACTGSLIGGQLAGASFPAAASCNAGAVSNAPCCYADYNKTGGIAVNDIFDFLNDWFAGSPYANTGGNGSAGPLAVQNIFDFLTNWFTGGC